MKERLLLFPQAVPFQERQHKNGILRWNVYSTVCMCVCVSCWFLGGSHQTEFYVTVKTKCQNSNRQVVNMFQTFTDVFGICVYYAFHMFAARG